ncbi:hypothetical protein [Sulfurimonas sp. CS5]|jgi:uncharacterized protein YjcR|uniref:hypothetical protein n=1 Tax=Sulfurimonas sp. CS5 TaxID=3391145 RepID=UPI0039EC4C30
MTKKELAERLGIDVKTLKSWEEQRPEVMRLVRLGLATEKHVQDIESYLQEIKKTTAK